MHHILASALALLLWLPAAALLAQPAPPGLGAFQVTGTVTDKTVDVVPGHDGGCPDTPTVELWIAFEGNTVPAFCLGPQACLCKEVSVGSLVAVEGRLVGSRVNAGDPVNEAWIVILELADVTVLHRPVRGEPKNPEVAYIQESR